MEVVLLSIWWNENRNQTNIRKRFKTWYVSSSLLYGLKKTNVSCLKCVKFCFVCCFTSHIWAFAWCLTFEQAGFIILPHLLRHVTSDSANSSERLATLVVVYDKQRVPRFFSYVDVIFYCIAIMFVVKHRIVILDMSGWEGGRGKTQTVKLYRHVDTVQSLM